MVVIKGEEEEKKRDGCCKRCCAGTGRCCRRFGRCCQRFSYYLISDRMMIFINLIAAAAIFVSMGERLAWGRYAFIPRSQRTDNDRKILNSSEYKENSSAYYYILVAFITCFTVALIMAEFRSRWMRKTFAVLDSKFGRGFFLIFIGLMIPQNDNEVSIAMSVITNFIGLVNIFVGYN